MNDDTHRLKAALVAKLRTVACCDLRVGVGELGLVDDVSVTDDGVAHVDVLPCCTYGMARLQHEVEAEAGTVAGVTGVEVDVAWDETWDPGRVLEGAEEATPDIDALAEAHDLEPRWKEYQADDGD